MPEKVFKNKIWQGSEMLPMARSPHSIQMNAFELTRRQLLANMTTGIIGVSLSHLFDSESMAGTLREPHFAPRAKQVLQIFCPGAASQVDLWDYKPMLEKMHGQPMPGGETEVTFQGKNGNLMKSPWDFIPSGQCGKMISSMMPHMAKHVDDIAFIHSMTSRTNTHGPGCIYMNSCFTREGYPSAGSWVSYGLG